MISGQRSRSSVPLDEQSVLPTGPGVPWWGAILVAGGLTSLGAIIDTWDSSDLGGMFKFLFVVGVIAAVLLVRNRALFTAAAQPPLIMVGVGAVALYFAQEDKRDKTSLKEIVLQIVIPIAKMFPMMAWTFAIVIAIAVARYFLSRNAHKASTADTTEEPKTQRLSSQRKSRRPSTSHRRRNAAAAKAAAVSTKADAAGLDSSVDQDSVRAGRTRRPVRATGTDNSRHGRREADRARRERGDDPKRRTPRRGDDTPEPTPRQRIPASGSIPRWRTTEPGATPPPGRRERPADERVAGDRRTPPRRRAYDEPVARSAPRGDSARSDYDARRRHGGGRRRDGDGPVPDPYSGRDLRELREREIRERGERRGRSQRADRDERRLAEPPAYPVPRYRSED